MIYNININWTVTTTKKAENQAVKLGQKELLKLRLLYKSLTSEGPAVPSWPNYGKLKGRIEDERHCHLQKGKPTYVCCWRVKDKKRKIIEVYYVGTHEKAPY